VYVSDGNGRVDIIDVLIIAADEGIMPQTREHILLARQVNVPYIVGLARAVELAQEFKGKAVGIIGGGPVAVDVAQTCT
jgi:translation elongation factor EF-Tu-like GTPase